eukprot:6467096-Amphidinium_carterae.3
MLEFFLAGLNWLAGEIPLDVGLARQLKQLVLSGTSHEGTLPCSITRLTDVPFAWRAHDELGSHVSLVLGHGLHGNLPPISWTVFALSLWANSLVLTKKEMS